MICSQGEVGIGIYGRAGDAIDRLGLICEKWQPPIKAQGRVKVPPPTTPPPPPPPKFIKVLLSVDVCASAAGCNKQTRLSELPKDTQGVTLVERKDPWYHVKWPAGDGWVYSGPGWESLELP
jgi:hypothetical protein